MRRLDPPCRFWREMPLPPSWGGITAAGYRAPATSSAKTSTSNMKTNNLFVLTSVRYEVDRVAFLVCGEWVPNLEGYARIYPVGFCMNLPTPPTFPSEEERSVWLETVVLLYSMKMREGNCGSGDKPRHLGHDGIRLRHTTR
ncbi:hypothetical protein CLAIMM_13774 isoform 2 [Cladophialophora immunda]|nr:hypothetical protein CLAIMM_13774 isoform 2 [Cladophialophora immunda]